MGLLDFLRRPDINAGVLEWSQTEGAVLLDVRTAGEYREGRIPGSVNLPLQELDGAEEMIRSTDTPVYVYCLSGGRSRRAAAMLQGMGYTCVKNLGGIASYSGKVER